MAAIIKREFNAYFRSPLGYVFIAVYLFFSGTYFNQVLTSGMASLFPQIYYGMFSIILLLLPLLTMRLMSEDKKLKTDQLLLTSPVSVPGLVLGKFIAALSVYAICVGFTLIYGVVFSRYTDPGWALIFGNVVGAILFGGAFIAIGIFISSLTESMVIAAMGTFVVSALFILLDILPANANSKVLDFIVKWGSFVERYTPFTQGLLDVSSIIFFLSVAAIFLFLSVRVIESKRWR